MQKVDFMQRLWRIGDIFNQRINWCDKDSEGTNAIPQTYWSRGMSWEGFPRTAPTSPSQRGAPLVAVLLV
jgi:hypothetical protein